MFRNALKPLNWAKAVYSVAMLAVFLLVSVATAHAGQVTLAWNASTGPVGGYRVYYGTTSGSYPSNVNAGNTTQYPVTTLTDGTTYYFAVKAYDSAGKESGYSNEVNNPIAKFIADKTTVTTSNPVKLTDSSTGTVTGWSWNFGDNTTSTAQSPSKTYSTAGTYTVSLVVTGPGGTSPKTTKTITVNATTTAPVASFTVSPTSGTTASVFTFTNNSTGNITAWSWNFGDGTTSTAKSPVRTYANAKPDPYTVSLTATGPGGSNTATKQISVTEAPPLANFSASPTSGSTSTVFTFTDNSSGKVTTWSWNFGDGTAPSTNKSPTKTYSKPGTYTVSLTTTGPGGSDTASKTNYISVTSSLLSRDIGSVGLVGSANYANGTYTLKGSGADIWGTTDAFRFTYQPLNGNGSIVARVASMTNTNPGAKAGVMIRESLNANSTHAMMVVTPSCGVAFQRRLTTGGSSSHTSGAAVTAPYWVKLTRVGNNFTTYQSADGNTWKQIGSAVTINMATSVFVGLAVTSHTDELLNTAILDNVSIQ